MELLRNNTAATTKENSDKFRKLNSKLTKEDMLKVRKEIIEEREMQGQIIRSILEEKESEMEWFKYVEGIPSSLLKFGVNYITNTLPSQDNHRRWFKAVDQKCELCNQADAIVTQILSFCPYSLGTLHTEFNRYCSGD